MQFAKKIVLHCPNGVPLIISVVAQQFLECGVRFVGTVGPRCEEIESIIDDACIMAGSPEMNFILTSSHPEESLQAAIEFAECIGGEYEGDVQVVELL